eukprot:TRINITY_DN1493_c0_g2_i1.p1 TRINITY_DN1493_c0_g2~~TRINITY_DN1493_c0_g2_i1.p1  ORF type:complete len:161 (-),score=22.77 TRINITY_DN1493_c0_g2_i1:53-535(-)
MEKCSPTFLKLFTIVGIVISVAFGFTFTFVGNLSAAIWAFLSSAIAALFLLDIYEISSHGHIKLPKKQYAVKTATGTFAIVGFSAGFFVSLIYGFFETFNAKSHIVTALMALIGLHWASWLFFHSRRYFHPEDTVIMLHTVPGEPEFLLGEKEEESDNEL